MPKNKAENRAAVPAPARISVVAPQGWGKTWFGKMVALELVKWKGGRVALADSGGFHAMYGPKRRPVVARIELEQMDADAEAYAKHLKLDGRSVAALRRRIAKAYRVPVSMLFGGGK